MSNNNKQAVSQEIHLRDLSFLNYIVPPKAVDLIIFLCFMVLAKKVRVKNNDLKTFGFFKIKKGCQIYNPSPQVK